MFWLVWARFCHTNISSLLISEFGQLSVQCFQLQTSHFFIEVLGQGVNTNWVLVGVALYPQLDLGNRLVGEGRAHHVRRMACTATQIDQAALGQQDDAFTVREDHMIDLWLDLFPLVFFQRCNVDFVVEVADVADDGIVLHLGHMVMGNDVEVAGRGDEDVSMFSGVFHGDYAVAFHCSLQGADRIDFGDPDLSRQGTQCLRRTLAHIAVTGNNRNFAGNHDVCRTLDAIDQ